VLGREVASRVCVACIPSDRKGLAPAAAPVNLALIARPAGFVHPPGATEKLKRFRFLPDILEPKIANGIELKPGDGFGGALAEHPVCSLPAAAPCVAPFSWPRRAL